MSDSQSMAKGRKIIKLHIHVSHCLAYYNFSNAFIFINLEHGKMLII